MASRDTGKPTSYVAIDLIPQTLPGYHCHQDASHGFEVCQEVAEFSSAHALSIDSGGDEMNVDAADHDRAPCDESSFSTPSLAHRD